MPKRYSGQFFIVAFILVAYLLLPAPGAGAFAKEGGFESRFQTEGIAAPGLHNPDVLAPFVDGLIVSAMADYHIPGVVVGIVTADDVLMLKGYGIANAQTGEKVDPAKHLFRIASITKTFTAVAIMQLVESGQVGLEDDIRTYLGELAFDDKMGSITVANLLTHTSGFDDPLYNYYGANPDLVGASTADQLEAYAMPQVRAPGEVVSYSNYGFSLLGEIIARVSGKPYAQYIQDEILAPLEMESSTVGLRYAATVDDNDQRQKLSANEAKSHKWRGGRFEVLSFPESVRALAPEGGMSSTAADMTKFMQAMLRDGQAEGGQVLAPATVDQMRSTLFSHLPGRNGNAYGFWQVSIGGYDVYEHGGSINDFRSKMALIPELGIGVFVSTNAASGGRISMDFPRRVLEYFGPSRTYEAPVPPADFASRAAQYTGSFLSTRRPQKTFGKVSNLSSGMEISANHDGLLLIHYRGEVQRFVEVAPDEFMSVTNSDYVKFSGSDGRRSNFLVFESDPYSAYERRTFWERPETLKLPLLATVLAIAGFFGRHIVLVLRAGLSASLSEIKSGGWALLCTTIVWTAVLVTGVATAVEIRSNVYLLYEAFPFAPLPLLQGLIGLVCVMTILSTLVLGTGKFGRIQLNRLGMVQYVVTLIIYSVMLLAFWQWNIVL